MLGSTLAAALGVVAGVFTGRLVAKSERGRTVRIAITAILVYLAVGATVVLIALMRMG